MKKTLISTMLAITVACTACPSAPAAPAAVTAPVPVPAPAAVPRAAPVAATAEDPALRATAMVHREEPDYEQLTARLEKLAREKAKACAAVVDPDGPCDDAFFLNCGAGEPQPVEFDRLEGTTAFYKEKDGTLYSTVVFQQEGGVWKIDSIACGKSPPAMPWAR